MGRRARQQEQLRQAMCVGKQEFDRVLAERVAARMRRRATSSHDLVRAYQCRFCRGWHVGRPARA